MASTREPLLFVGVAAVVGLFTWLDLSGRYADSRLPAARATQAEELPRPPEVRLLGGSSGAGPQRPSSVFAPPRELLPLDPLDLEDPPNPPLPVRRPAEVPGLLGAAATVYRVPAESLGELSLSGFEEAQVGTASDSAGLAQDFSASATISASGALSGGNAESGESLELRHDWIVRADSSRRVYGSILNDDPVGLAARPGEDLQFQQISERTGARLGAPFRVPRDEVIEWGLARTLANETLRRSRQIGDGPAGAVARRALVLDLLQRSAREPAALLLAQEEIARARKASATDAATLRLAAEVHRRSHDLEGELGVYADAEAAGQADPALLAAHARLAAGLGLPERAVELLRSARTAGRPGAEVPFVEGLLHLQAGRAAEALTALRAAEDLPFAGPQEDRQKRELIAHLGAARLAVGDVDGARREAQRLLLDQPADPIALNLLGAVQSAAGELPAAAASFAAALAAEPYSATAATNGALAAWRLREGDEAVRLLRRAIELDPLESVRPLLALGFVHEDAGEVEPARDLYAQALIVEPGHPEALYRLGRRHRLDGDPGAAIGTLRESLRLTGSETLLLLELARASRDVARHEEALRYAREAERLEPEDPVVAWELGLTQLAAGDVRGCVAPLERAVGGGARGAHAALAVAAYRRGEVTAARHHLDEVAKAQAGRSEDPLARWSAATAAAIDENLARRQWVDRFGRSSLQRGWTEHAWDGSPVVRSEDGPVIVTGLMERPRETERPGLSRAVDGRGFHACQAELAVQPGAETRAGLSLTFSQAKGAQGRQPKARLSIWIDVDGRVRLSALDNFDTVLHEGLELGPMAEPGVPLRLGIERSDALNGRFSVSVDGRRAGPEVELKALRDFRNVFELAVFAEAAPGRRAEAVISLVRIVQAP